MHKDFDAARRAYAPDRDPVTFTLGGELFTVLPDPTLGDTFELYDAPEPTPENEQESVRILTRFIRRMIPEEERPRFDLALYRIPSTHGFVIIECATYIAEQVVQRPTEPPRTSSSGRRPTGKKSTKRVAGLSPLS